MDASIFSMFAFSDAFDYLLDPMKTPPPSKQAGNAQHILKEGIVNPLRKYAFFMFTKGYIYVCTF